MVSEANRYEKREAENHRLESQKHAENADKLGFQQDGSGEGTTMPVACAGSRAGRAGVDHERGE